MQSLEFFAEQSRVTSPGIHADSVHRWPRALDELVDLIQHLVVYDVVARDFYGYTIPSDRQDEIHIRTVEDLLNRLSTLDSRPLTQKRPIEARLVGRCHAFMWLLIAALRAQGIPARARCGFGSYFNPPNFEDHWVCEYWNAADERWILVDTQFDDVWRERLHIDHDVLDVPRDRLLVAGDAWRRCRDGDLDPQKFGIEFAHLRGLWYVAGSVIRDVAALNKVEMRPWDVWGAQPPPNDQLNAAQCDWFDDVATLTAQADHSFDRLRRMYQTDDRLRVPDVVHNALLNRTETVAVEPMRRAAANT